MHRQAVRLSKKEAAVEIEQKLNCHFTDWVNPQLSLAPPELVTATFLFLVSLNRNHLWYPKLGQVSPPTPNPLQVPPAFAGRKRLDSLHSRLEGHSAANEEPTQPAHPSTPLATAWLWRRSLAWFSAHPFSGQHSPPHPLQRHSTLCKM